MDLSSNLDQYIHESIEHTLGLPVSSKTLELKLAASEEARNRLQNQVFLLENQLKEKDQKLDLSKAEAIMNAQALKKCIEEKQNLAAERENLLQQCRRWEKECALYDRDREALMEFGNDADERAKEAEVRAFEAENNCRRFSEELEYYKQECEMRMVNEARATEELQLLRQRLDELELARLQSCSDNHLACSRCSLLKNNEMMDMGPLATVPDDSSEVSTTEEVQILQPMMSSVLAKAISIRKLKDEVAANPCSFLEAHVGQEPCKRLWESLKPLTRDILGLAAEVELLQKDKENLRINLHTAEEEVKVLFEENNMLNMENEKLLRKYTREKQHLGSEGKHTTSVSGKGKRKSSPRTRSSTDGTIEFCEPDSPRQPLSPLQHNSPNSRMRKK